MTSRYCAPWSAILALLFSSVAAQSGCSSDDDSDASQPVPGQAPVLDGSGTIFDGDDGAIPSAGGGFDSSQACVGREAGTELAPTIVELLVDTSLSMDERAPGSSRSKWLETRQVMLDAIGLMPATTSIGVTFYPDVEVGADECFDGEADVAVAPLGSDSSVQRQELRRAFERESPRGSTPTHDAYRYALGELASVSGAGERFLVLITDGTPTYALGCQGSGTPQDPADPAPLIPEAASALGRGIKTFVIGSPGSEGARESLSQMAQAGGTAAPGCSHDGPRFCHFDMTEEEDFAGALSDAFAAIAGIALSCTYDIPDPPNGATLDLTKVNVLFRAPGATERETIPQSAPGTCTDGWQYSEDRSQILLCGQTCDRVSSSTGLLSLELGCTTRSIF